jgi:putative hydrolase of the HAD superfamily
VHELLVKHGYRVSLKELTEIGRSIGQAYRIFQDQAQIEVSQRFLNQCALNAVGVFDDRIITEADEVMNNLAIQYTHLTSEAIEILPTLQSLGLRLGILSNALNTTAIQHVLGKAKLIDIFDAIIISADLGIRKPKTSLFTYALRKLGTRPTETIMVGNDLYADIHGANEAGLQTIFITRLPQNTNHPKAGKPTHMISQLRELISIIEAAQ